MPLTPETLPRHELVGLPVRVAAAANPDLVGIAGRVVSETMQTLTVERRRDGATRTWQVPKQGATFEFACTDEAAAAEQKAAGTAFELGQDTADGATPGQSWSVTTGDSRHGVDDGESVAYVTVDGSRLLSRPARRTETTGDSRWR